MAKKFIIQWVFLSVLLGSIAVADNKSAESHLFNKTSYGYGEYLVAQTLKSLPDSLANYDYRFLTLPEEKRKLLHNLYRLAIEVNERIYKGEELVFFKDGSDPIFQLSPEEPSRTAVTGTSIDTPVYFNLSRINDHDIFRYENAVSLWIHELGHKIDPKPAQSEIDAFAAELASFYSDRDQFYSLEGGLHLFVIQHHYNSQRPMWEIPSTPPSVAVVRDGLYYSRESSMFKRKKFYRGEETNDELRKEEDYWWCFYTGIEITQIESSPLDEKDFKLSVSFLARSVEKRIDGNESLELGTSTHVLDFKVDKSDLTLTEAFFNEIPRSYREVRTAHSISGDVEINSTQTQGQIEIKITIEDTPGVSNLVSPPSAIYYEFDGVVDYFSIPIRYREIDSQAVRHEFQSVGPIPDDVAGKKIKIIGIRSSVYMKHPPRDNSERIDLFYMIPIEEPFEVDFRSSPNCEAVLDR